MTAAAAAVQNFWIQIFLNIQIRLSLSKFTVEAGRQVEAAGRQAGLPGGRQATATGSLLWRPLNT